MKKQLQSRINQEEKEKNYNSLFQEFIEFVQHLQLLKNLKKVLNQK